jgi:hypothetical protein
VETKNTVPLWLALAITVIVSLPFGLWLGNWNLPLWVAFIVWAQYFNLGAKPEMLKTIIPAFILGVIGAVIASVLGVLLNKALDDAKIYVPGDLGIAIAYFVWFCILIYSMKYMPITNGPGTTPFFNGVAMGLAVYFTGQYATAFGTLDATLVPVACGVAAILGGLLGAFLGWFDVVILFPREVPTAR